MVNFKLKSTEELEKMNSIQISDYIDEFEEWSFKVSQTLDDLYAKAYNKERQEYRKQLNLLE